MLLIEKTSNVPMCTKPGWHSVGYVLSPEGRMLLVRDNHAGRFAGVDANGNLVHLDTGTVARSLWEAKEYAPQTKSQLMRIDADLFEFAKALGNGNFSKGVRVALRSLQQ